MVKDTDLVYITLLKTTSLCTFVANKSHRYTEASSDSLPTVKSNTIFGNITLMALEKYSLEIEKNLDLPLFWPDVMSNSNNTPCLKQKRFKAFSINITKKTL